jgi:hypothetical protein
MIFAAALMVSSVALAQSTASTEPSQDTSATTQSTTTDTTTTSTKSKRGTRATHRRGTRGGASMSTDTTTSTDTSMGASSGGGAPERDARGIPVVSAPATPPAGANEPVAPGTQATVNPNQAAAFQTQPATGDDQPCTATVTDHCVQTYEGRGGGKRGHRRHR